MVNLQHRMKKLGGKQFVPSNEKIFDQLQVLKNWWREIDPKFFGFVELSKFVNFAIKKRILGRETEKDKLIKSTIGSIELTINKKKILMESQFMKIFARALLRGAISNIYEHT